MHDVSVIRAIKRFLARRGIIKLFISHNFSSFSSHNLKLFLRNLDIDWTYILPRAPWWGGFYERMVRTMKSSLKKVLGKSRLTFEEMETAVAEVGMMINSRSLTYIQDDVHEILTPSHLMLGRRLLTN